MSMPPQESKQKALREKRLPQITFSPLEAAEESRHPHSEARKQSCFRYWQKKERKPIHYTYNQLGYGEDTIFRIKD